MELHHTYGECGMLYLVAHPTAKPLLAAAVADTHGPELQASMLTKFPANLRQFLNRNIFIILDIFHC
jgi:hypothetical protein